MCEDESTFLYDSISRKVWVKKGSKPSRTVTGLHKRVHIFGFLTDDKKKIFHQSGKLNSIEFVKALSQMLARFKKVILVLDRAPWHRAKRVQKYLAKHKDDVKIIWFPRGCPEMNPVEECWRQAKKEVNGGRVHESFEVMRKELRRFLKYADFKQDMRKYLRR